MSLSRVPFQTCWGEGYLLIWLVNRKSIYMYMHIVTFKFLCDISIERDFTQLFGAKWIKFYQKHLPVLNLSGKQLIKCAIWEMCLFMHRSCTRTCKCTQIAITMLHVYFHGHSLRLQKSMKMCWAGMTRMKCSKSIYLLNALARIPIEDSLGGIEEWPPSALTVNLTVKEPFSDAPILEKK